MYKLEFGHVLLVLVIVPVVAQVLVVLVHVLELALVLLVHVLVSVLVLKQLVLVLLAHALEEHHQDPLVRPDRGAARLAVHPLPPIHVAVLVGLFWQVLHHVCVESFFPGRISAACLQEDKCIQGISLTIIKAPI